MVITLYGTRGSCPVSGPDFQHYGGNTTCLRVQSDCLPAGQWLVIDMGTGILPLSWDFIRDGGQSLTVLMTHYHHDHTQGVFLTPFPYLKHVPVNIYGPYERGEGAREMLRTLMRPPYFPVHFEEYGSHISCHNVAFPNSTILLIHPAGGVQMLNQERFDRANADGQQMPFPRGKRFDLAECLVVRLYRSNHPEQTISYRFEELRTGEIFTFVTDHENQDCFPARFRQHLTGSELLVMDCQYTRAKYDSTTGGYGHSTPDYVARIAGEVGIPRVGLTHHDPPSTDTMIDEIVATARAELPDAGVFGCHDYQVVPVRATLAELGLAA